MEGLAAVSLVGDGALVEVELPAFVPEDPERGTVRDCHRRGGAIGGERDVLCQLLNIKVVDGRGSRSAAHQDVDGLLTVEDTPGAAKLLEVFCKQRNEGFTVGFAVRVEESLFEGIEMVL